MALFAILTAAGLTWPRSDDLLAAASQEQAPTAASAQAPPNFVVVMVDDLDVETLEVMLDPAKNGYGEIKLKRLWQDVIQKGFTFAESFVTVSLCCPSRTSFVTGQYAHNHGVKVNSPPGGIASLKDSSTIATWLHELPPPSNYRTSHIGKYLNGYGMATLQEHYPAAEPRYDPRYIPPGWDDWHGLIDPTTYSVYGYRINDNGTIHAPSKYQTYALADRAEQFIRNAAGSAQPFFLVVTPIAPHLEGQWAGQGGQKPCTDRLGLPYPCIRPAPEDVGEFATERLHPADKPNFMEADMSDKPVWLQDESMFPRIDIKDPECAADPRCRLAYHHMELTYRSRLASLLAVDRLIGRIVDALQVVGKLDDTVILFTSDNGYLNGEHRIATKVFAYDESIRVPLFIRVPSRLRASGTYTAVRITDKIALNIDLAPTIADLAGVQLAPPAPLSLFVDGRSLAPMLRDAAVTEWRRRFLVEHWWHAGEPVPTFAAVRTGSGDPGTPNRLYVESYSAKDGDVIEHYDMSIDQHQENSLHGDPWREAERARLRGWVSALRSCAYGTCQCIDAQDAPGAPTTGCSLAGQGKDGGVQPSALGDIP